MLGTTLAAGTSLLAPATPVRVGELQASAQRVKPRPSSAAARSLVGSSAGRGEHKRTAVKKPRTGGRGFSMRAIFIAADRCPKQSSNKGSKGKSGLANHRAPTARAKTRRSGVCMPKALDH